MNNLSNICLGKQKVATDFLYAYIYIYSKKTQNEYIYKRMKEKCKKVESDNANVERVPL